MAKNLRVPQTEYSYLDETPFREAYGSGALHNNMRFYVEGIRCAKCLRKIEALSETIPGLQSIRVEMDTNVVHVAFDPELSPPSYIAEKITALGFKVKPLIPGTDSEANRKIEDRKALIRLAVAGACAGNIMGFALAIYFGSEGIWLKWFSWLSFILYLPVVTYVALPFYRGAIESLKLKQVSIDLPMAVASLAGFLFSTVQLFRGERDFYFDSISGLLFLILLARYVQQSLQRHYLQVSAPFEELKRVRQLKGGKWLWQLSTKLNSGDRFLLQSGEVLPVEAKLLSPRAHFSQAWLTGESKPKVFLSGATISAGAQILGTQALFEFLKPLAETEFGRTMQEVQRFALTKNRAISLADRWTQRLLGGVFCLALLFMLIYWSVDAEEAIRRALALIVIACPCAMAFGTPLAMAFSLKKARAAGLLIADANIFEEVSKIENVFFDKTGTLTELDLSLAADANRVPAVYQKVILALENQSMHPIAFAFRRAFSAIGKLPPVSNFKETPGVGVSGYLYGKFYSLQRDVQNEASGLGCALVEDDRVIYQFAFTANIRPGAQEILQELRQKGFKVSLVSGDNSKATLFAADKLAFAEGEVYSGLSPSQKAELVSARGSSMMIGDGINDAVALMQASVGVAVAGAVGPALQSAKVYLQSENLMALGRLFVISRDAFLLIRQNLMLSLFYNLIAGTAALMGFVNPLVAAVLMPISSGLILFNTWRWGRR